MLEFITDAGGGAMWTALAGVILIWGPRWLLTVLLCIAAHREDDETFNRLIRVLKVLCKQTPKDDDAALGGK